MTSSNVSKLLVQVSKIDVSITQADKSANASAAGLFENTLKNVANKVPKVESNTNSADSLKKTQKTTAEVDTSASSTKREVVTEKAVEEQSDAGEAQVVDKVEEVVEEVVDVIKEELDVTDEDIKLAMENLGLTFIDLLNPQSLAQLVTEITGETDSINLIMSEDFKGILDKVTELTDQLFEETKISFVELKDLIVQEQPEETPEIISTQPVEVKEEAPIEMTDDAPVITEEVVKDEAPKTVVVSEKKQEVEEEPQKKDTEISKDVEPVKTETTTAQDNNKESFDFSKEQKSNAFEFDVKEKVSREPVKHEAVNPFVAAQNEIQFAPEEKVVTLPTGETVSADDIANQLVEQARVLTDSESTTMEITLNPEGLGKIFLEVTQKGNEITAKIFTENDAVKHALESQMANLRTEMSQNSTKVTSIEVSVGTHEFERNLDENQSNDSRREEQSREQSKRSNRINLNRLDDLVGMMSEEDILIAQMMQDNGGTLDFMA
ncbi:flagellar hook-length control protein FliK [Pseudobutyrivibrio xylanivorans]|uniref:Flagellar hook-length control protein-like C-terminal domain-containing protein n=1 Tax=Pseudobutyrivibrio xylanivorans TaxID=185007 RepID=A0A5P6VVU8_PSEXY|nr:flagellar hook-length control protein FliK [Pseudobutyrivibrio xylanivorans]QFJ55481.1 hypothetical protein FXF36_11680 [Pseudobutyrivibrio xylanivorans]